MVVMVTRHHVDAKTLGNDLPRSCESVIYRLRASGFGIPKRVITVTFYSALHLVDAFFLEETGRTPESHRERNSVIRAHPFLSVISGEYNSLRTTSERARYQPDKRVPPYAGQ
jgi:hypothetical protein